MSISVKMTSDFICPWCLIGESRLFKAIETLPEGIEVDVQWLPFELNPDMQKQGINRKAYRSLKFGSWEKSQALDAHTVAVGKAEGISFDYDRMEVTPNTLAAHRLSWLAAQEGRQREVVEGLLRAYFSKGRNIGDHDVLVEIACEAGLDEKKVRLFLESNDGTASVRSLEASSQAKAVQGVPHFDIEGIIVTGAQRPEKLRQAILDAHTRKTRDPSAQQQS